jgi:ABC-type maltose transport system permease subunit
MASALAVTSSEECEQTLAELERQRLARPVVRAPHTSTRSAGAAPAYASVTEASPVTIGIALGLLMAASVLATAPLVILFFVAQRRVIEGIALTGLKGA